MCNIRVDEEIDEDARLKRSKVNSIEFLTTTRYLDKMINPSSQILDACVGGGIYAFYLASQAHKVTAGDLIEKHVNLMMEIQEQKGALEGIYNQETK